MILVDTNVIAEPLRKSPDTGVIDWIDAQSLETLYLSAITVAELRFGAASLPAGKRRDGLRESLETRVLPLFAGRVLAFDLPASQAYATAAANRMTVATRDTAAFEAAGVPVINPRHRTQE